MGRIIFFSVCFFRISIFYFSAAASQKRSISGPVYHRGCGDAASFGKAALISSFLPRPLLGPLAPPVRNPLPEAAHYQSWRSVSSTVFRRLNKLSIIWGPRLAPPSLCPARSLRSGNWALLGIRNPGQRTSRFPFSLMEATPSWCMVRNETIFAPAAARKKKSRRTAADFPNAA